MEKIGDDDRKPTEEKLKYQSAIRCAKVAHLLSSLRSSSDNPSTSNISQIQEELDLLKMEKLKLEITIWKLMKENHRLGFLFDAAPILCFLFVLQALTCSFVWRCM